MPTPRVLTTLQESRAALRVGVLPESLLDIPGSQNHVSRLIVTSLACTALLLFLLATPCAYARREGQEAPSGSVADTAKCMIALRINGAEAQVDSCGESGGRMASPGNVGTRSSSPEGVTLRPGSPGGGTAKPGAARSTPRSTQGHRIDGVLDEPFWKYAPRSGDFVQYQPDEGKPASESTFVRIAFDDEALYVGLEMYDSEPAKIVDRLTRRDRWLEADMVHVMIDSHHDHLTAYCFTLYSSGTQRDAYYYNDTWSDDTWDAVWESGTQKTAWGWTAELRIPFHCLRFSAEDVEVRTADAGGGRVSATGADDPADLAGSAEAGVPQSNGHKWGIYVSRNIPRKGELDRWNHIPDSAGGFVSKFGHVSGIFNIRPPRRLEVLPYAVSYAETEPKGPGNPDGRDYTHNAGFDAKYGITSDITLNATINPDFGQVEADQTVLNLSTFETWYPEKRPFFIEGNSIFSTFYSLFYSRRIGKSPSLWPGDVDYYEDRQAATTILGAAKVSGRTAGGTSIGLMEAVTQREEATYRDSYGVRKTAVIEPEANYFVARVKQDIMQNSSVGVMATAVNQKDTSPDYTGGIDWNLRFRDGDYQVSGQTVASKNRFDKSGWGGQLQLEKSGGQNFRGTLSADYEDRNLDLNRIGFLSRANQENYWAWLQYRTTKKWWIIRRTWNNLNLGYTDNLDGVGLVRGGNFNNSIQLANLWEVGGGSWVDYDITYADTETRGGPPSPIPVGQNWWVSLNTDRSKWLGFFGQVGGGDTYDGHYNEYSMEMVLQPRSNIELAVAPSYRTHWAVSRWLTYLTDAEGNRTDDIFGEQKLHRLDLTVRGTFTFTRDLTLQLYAQPFFAAVDYSNFKKLVPPRSFEYVDASVYNEEEQRPDFNWTSFNSNVVLRWEYRPGSTLYLVWTQARQAFSNVGDFDFSRDWNALYGSEPGNTFLAKVSYWWSL